MTKCRLINTLTINASGAQIDDVSGILGQAGRIIITSQGAFTLRCRWPEAD